MRFLTGNVLFLALIMLIEPKTSPIKVHQQVAFGIVAALVLTIFIALSRSGSLIIGDLSLTALTEVLTILSVNLIFFIKKAIPSKPNVNQL
jgi:hypothetical protein